MKKMGVFCEKWEFQLQADVYARREFDKAP